MNEEQKKNCKILRSMESGAAADWLLDDLGQKANCFYVDRRTWKKSEQIRLADYFLSLIPHSNDRCYISLLSIMSIPSFVNVVVSKIEKVDSKDLDFLEYYLLRSVRDACKNQTDYKALSYLSKCINENKHI